MKTLYISDLDGTLLNKNVTTSQFTNNAIKRLTEKGFNFSFATARSHSTIKKVADGIEICTPIVTYNGTFIVENDSGKILLAQFFDDGINDLLDELIKADIYPIVYSCIDNKEKYSYVFDKSNDAVKRFVATRENDSRDNPVSSVKDLYNGRIFYITCMESSQKLEPLYEKYKEKYHCIYSVDIYSSQQWLEFMPLHATKANGVLSLKKMLGCDRIVAFGDGVNDIDMFKIADECYAVSNAADELKEIADGVIGSNDDDGVAQWLSKNVLNNDL